MTHEEEALMWAAMNKYNFDVMYNGPMFVGAEYTARLRPYKQTKDREIMYLGSGESLLLAMAGALSRAVKGAHEKCDWSKRDARTPAASILDGPASTDTPTWLTTLGQEGRAGQK